MASVPYLRAIKRLSVEKTALHQILIIIFLHLNIKQQSVENNERRFKKIINVDKRINTN